MKQLNFRARQPPTFPPVEQALADPNGLLAIGGALTEEWLIAAYQRGIFPWYNDDADPIMWWCPDPRGVLFPERIRITRSLAKRLRNGGFTVTFDRAFREVIERCAGPRRPADGRPSGTWITRNMRRAYERLHERGLAHSVEVWETDLAADAAPEDAFAAATSRRLVGGLYGVSLGRMFFGESMFSEKPDASKIALCHLARQLERWRFWLIDCQLPNPHLLTLGIEEMPRRLFQEFVTRNAAEATRLGPWEMDHTPADWSPSDAGRTR